MARAPSRSSKVNLEQASVLLVDDNPQALDILASIVQGFGVREQIRCASALDATEILKRRMVDLILVDCAMPEMDGYDFVKWLRRETPAPTCMTPVIMLTGHAAPSKVHKSRDCGASFVVTKPLTPGVLLQRILWLANDEREFVKAPNYVGPDRRVRNFGPPLGMNGRRAGDLSNHIGEATEANMEQADIDSLMKVRRVAI
ncbi:response regulator [Brevundimonas sp. Root1279]|uniref:response regulator n=1 Tax=Brevundimonas sp. Root1279 TaxID=1736443 RepID=UPI0006F594BE|nr:response regulator [Brevundimonas sp. Root1279]KQW82645.1 two-component system response regulator [Brevundimonas sp. Root1279]